MWRVLVEGKWYWKFIQLTRHWHHSSASGFTTRSDIGPAREGPSAEAVAYVLGLVIKNLLLIHTLSDCRLQEDSPILRWRRMKDSF